MNLFKKYKEPLLYLFFGGLTTLVNLVGYYLLTRMLAVPYMQATVIAWILSVLFAYLTNKLWVFESKTCGFFPLLREAGSFFLFRLLSLFVDMAAMFALVDLLHVGDMFSKILSNVLVIVLNYLFSKLFIFKKGRDTL